MVTLEYGSTARLRARFAEFRLPAFQIIETGVVHGKPR